MLSNMAVGAFMLSSFRGPLDVPISGRVLGVRWLREGLKVLRLFAGADAVISTDEVEGRPPQR